jgi:hypothetical protein
LPGLHGKTLSQKTQNNPKQINKKCSLMDAEAARRKDKGVAGSPQMKGDME